MGLSQTLCLTVVGLCIAGCTSNPAAPVNQAFPIRQMDHFFGSLQAPRGSPNQYSTASPEYTHHRGYAPAYPPYN